MIGNRLFILLLFFTLIFPSYSDSISVYYEEGLSAYKKGQYNLSVQNFEFILALEWESSELYYNLGNSFFRLNDIPNAIWAYEYCLKLSPNHADARYNLQLVNLKVVDKIELPNPPFYLEWYLSTKENFTSNEWINISLFIFLFFTLTSVLIRLKINKYIHSVRAIILVLFFISTLFTIDSILTFTSTKSGIISKLKVEVRSEPNKYSTKLFQVHEGLKVHVKNNEIEWIEIELLDGKSGWIANSEIKLIN